jgi:biotin carboxyl carrier protein
MSRKVVRAQYIVEDYFVIPENIDLDNTNQVKDWGVKLNVMHIYFVNGEELEIESQGYKDDFDFKRPTEYFHEDAEDVGFNQDNEGFEPVDIGEMSNVKPAPEPKPKVVEPEHEYDVVKKIIIDGKKYLRSKKTGNVYDYDAYVKEGEQVLVGKWNEEKQQIEFNNDITDLEKVNREKIIEKANQYSVNNGR